MKRRKYALKDQAFSGTEFSAVEKIPMVKRIKRQ